MKANAQDRPASGEPAPHSAHEYFLRLAESGQRAGRAGNYAIAAALVVRYRGSELVAIGHNTLFAENDPTGHAEVNAIRLARSIGLLSLDEVGTTLKKLEREGCAIVRAAPHERVETVLYATLEPCPMCTVCAINAGISRVVVAASDPPSGALCGGRIHSLPPVWADLANQHELAVVSCQSERPDDSESYVPAELKRTLTDMFTRSRTGLDEKLAADGVLNTEAIGRAVEAVLPERLR